MKIELVVTMDDGRILRGVTNLSAASSEPRQKAKGPIARSSEAEHGLLDYSLPTRAFMKRHAGDLSGPRKLTLLVASVAKGQTGTAVSRAEIEKLWSKMKGLLGGGYNAAYDTRARDNGWISSPKAGLFQLRDGWEGAIG